jgi:hypothetical protein
MEIVILRPFMMGLFKIKLIKEKREAEESGSRMEHVETMNPLEV